MCPSRAERKTAAPQGESLPLNARSRSALRGCATCGKKQKATEPPWNGFSRNLQASAFSRHTFQAADAFDHIRSHTHSKRLANGLDLAPTPLTAHWTTCYITEATPVACATYACDHTASSVGIVAWLNVVRPGRDGISADYSHASTAAIQISGDVPLQQQIPARGRLLPSVADARPSCG